MPIHSSLPPTILVVGPGPALVGGMAGVVKQILALDFDNYYRIEFAPITLSAGGKESMFRRIVRHGRQGLALLRHIRSSGAILVHLHTCSGASFYRSALDLALARWAGCPVVLHVHGAAFDVFHQKAGGAARRIIEGTLRLAECVVALSEDWRRKLQAMAPNARIVVVENATETRQRAAPQEHAGPQRFLMLARMDEWKGVDDLLDACRRLHDQAIPFQLVLAGPPGSAGDETVLNQKIRERGLAQPVQYVGSVQGVEKETLLEWADIYVQPSRHEGMPLALLEALAYGLPVVATRVGAVPEVIEDRRTGILVPPGQPVQLAAAMAEIVADSNRRAALSRAGRELILKRFSLSRLRDDLLALYDGVLAPRQSHRSTLFRGLRRVMVRHGA